MTALAELNQKFDLDILSEQLNSVVESKDPVGYMRNNINWEIDKDLDELNLNGFTNSITALYATNIGYEMWNPLKKFLNWLNKSKVAKKIKKILCSINAQIQEMIDEKTELKRIIEVALTAIIAAIGIGAINPMVLTLLVGFLATIILDGVKNFCNA